MLAREAASFWRENVIAVVIWLRVLARMSWWQEQVQSFYDQVRAKLSPIKIIALTFQVKNSTVKDWTFFENMRKHFNLNLALVVVLVLKAKALWRLRNERKNSIQMMHHYPDLGRASDWLNQFVANQMLYPDLGSDASSVWNFCTRFSDVITPGNQWWCRKMSAVLSGYLFAKIHWKTSL